MIRTVTVLKENIYKDKEHNKTTVVIVCNKALLISIYDSLSINPSDYILPQKVKIVDYKRQPTRFKYYAWMKHTRSMGKHLICAVIPYTKGNVKEIVNLYLFEKSLNELGETNENKNT